MSDYLFTIPDAGGNVPPDLSVAGALVGRGHRVRVLADPTLQAEVEGAGCEFRKWTRAPHRVDQSLENEIIRDWEAKTPIGGFIQMRDRISCGRSADFAADILEELDRRPADAIATDFLLPGAMIAAEAAELPLAIIGNTIYPFPVRGVPPMGPGLMPSTSAIGRSRDAILSAATRRLWNGGLPALNATRAGLGLEPIVTFTDLYERADRFLILTSEAFDFPSDGRPANVRYAGPRLDDPEWTEPWSEPAGSEPLVLVGLSSTRQGQVPMLRKVAAALGRLPVRGLITCGPTVSPGEIGAPANVTVVASAPHQQVLKRAAAVITHAGHGTAIKALAAGVPTLCIPMGRDQNDVAARVAGSGAGLRLRPGASEAKIAAATERLLGEPSFEQAAKRMASRIAEDLTTDRAVAELEALPRPTAAPVGAAA